MYKAVLTLLLGLMLLASGSANALSLNCQRTVESHDAFSTIQAFESWFPKTIRPTKADQIPTSKDTQVRFQIKGAIYDLTPSKWMLGRLPEKGGYKSVTGVRYKCNASSHEVKLALVKNSESSNGSTQVATNSPTNAELIAAQKRATELGVNDRLAGFDNRTLCSAATVKGEWDNNPSVLGYVIEAKRRGLTCSVGQSKQPQVATNSPTNAELIAAQKRAAELEKQLALLQAKEELNQRQIASDNRAPALTIIQSGANGREGYLTGFVTDNVQVAEVLVDGAPISVSGDGSFEWSGFVPATGKNIIVEAIDTAALSSRQVVRLERGQIQQASGPRFDDLDPTAGKRVKRNENALALIVGISDYKRTEAPAVYADKDAQYFHDYASLKLGISDSNITTMINEKAEQGDVLLAVKDWLRRSSKPGKSDVYIFFAGHGLASQDGEKMYLLPFDGRPRLLEDTAVSRERLFTDIASANPRSVTVFLDTCYSGTTRGPEMLVASRPISIRAKESAIPEGFTVMTAAAGDQTAKPLEEAKHGMFSYFLMKGMEGDADANNDNQITAGELHEYVQKNVIQQSSGSQTPELQGDADRVLVRFQ